MKKIQNQDSKHSFGGGSFYNLLNKNIKELNITKLFILCTIFLMLVGFISYKITNSYALFTDNITGSKTIEISVGYEQIFNYTGTEQEYKIPATGAYRIELWGADGGSDTPEIGRGGYTAGTINLTKGDKIYFYVGQKGELGTLGNDTTQTPGKGAGKTFNGGGAGGNAQGSTTYKWSNYRGGFSGGGATDVRLINGNWNNSSSLASRIMVAGGSSGNYRKNSSRVTLQGTYGEGGGLTANKGAEFIYTLSSSNIRKYINNPGSGGSQTAGGTKGTPTRSSSAVTAGTFASGGHGDNSGSNINTCSGHSGGGGGYYGGGGAGNTDVDCLIMSGGGGSSYISGHTGCVAITSNTNTTPKSGCKTGTTNNDCSIHYSGKIFNDTVMIDGSGYSWTNVKSTKKPMPKPNGKTYELGQGNPNNGIAKIYFIG